MMKFNIKNSRFQIQDSIKESSIFNLQSSIRSNKGLTLLEIAISLAILSIALVALANLFPIGLKASRRASNFSEASILAQRTIENIKRAADVYDLGDDGPNIPSSFNDNDGIGYFELARQNVRPFFESGATISTGVKPISCKYDNTDMNVYIKVDDWDANNSGGLPDIDDVLLSQKVYVAIYWIEGDQPRADTFITYISNPFYEKYR